MTNKQYESLKEVMQEQLAYQKRISKDLHSLYFLVVASIILTFIFAIILAWYN